MKNLLLLTVISIFVLPASALSLGFDIGHTSFRYAEVGDNSKDDLYSLNSILLGVNVGTSINRLNLKGSVSAQLPYDFTFSDAFGTDEANYLEYFYYYGLNTQLSLSYEVIHYNKISLFLGTFLNYDYFYFKDMVVSIGSEFEYSVLGLGPNLSVQVPLGTSLYLLINGSYVFDFLPLYSRGNDFLWSDNILISASFVWEFDHE